MGFFSLFLLFLLICSSLVFARGGGGGRGGSSGTKSSGTSSGARSTKVSPGPAKLPPGKPSKEGWQISTTVWVPSSRGYTYKGKTYVQYLPPPFYYYWFPFYYVVATDPLQGPVLQRNTSAEGDTLCSDSDVASFTPCMSSYNQSLVYLTEQFETDLLSTSDENSTTLAFCDTFATDIQLSAASCIPSCDDQDQVTSTFQNQCESDYEPYLISSCNVTCADLMLEGILSNGGNRPKASLLTTLLAMFVLYLIAKEDDGQSED